jgi:hypothetical protein
MLSLLLLAFPALGQRTTVSLDLGWRVATAPEPACSYPVSMPGFMQGSGWPAPGNPNTASACEQAACDANAIAWSFCPGPTALDCGEDNFWNQTHGWYDDLTPPYCIIGNSGQLDTARAAGWTNRMRSQTIAEDAPQAQMQHDDSKWKVQPP